MATMTLPMEAVNLALEEYRAYLETLKNIHIDPRFRQKFGMSDIVQITLLEASRDLVRIQSMDTAGRKRWLRRMLMNNLLDELAKFLNRPAEVSLDGLRVAARESSRRVRDWVESEDTSPSELLIRKELELRLLEALAQIDERQCEALILQKYFGWKLDKIAEHMDCTAGAVAGLHARGLKALRKLLPDLE
jgi:RNA polymerase sigma-70 factor (subfamily 1)